MKSVDGIEDRTLGICLGASTLSVAEMFEGRIRGSRTPHSGRVSDTVQKILGDALPARIGVTGRKFRELITLGSISETEAVELAFDRIRDRYPETDSIISAGSESILLYNLDRNGRIRSVRTGNRCAAGTGEFFLQQIRRMDLEIQNAVELAAGSEPYNIANRCSVFSKSDCTHALNKGIEKGRVTAGLCRMMAVKMIELLRSTRSSRAIVIGGISLNSVVMDYLRNFYPKTMIPEEAPWFEALGAMIWAQKNGAVTEDTGQLVRTSYHPFVALPDLGSGRESVRFHDSAKVQVSGGEHVIGLDVGSTTTKAVLMRCEDKAVVAGVYLRTLGDPVGASRKCYRSLEDQVRGVKALSIRGLGVTGSGRRIAGLHGLTENVTNEIIAHAAAAVHFDPEVDTIFEIGGQDAKYTRITNGVPTDYAMNEACSAGTGSFLEEASSESFDVRTADIAGIALKSRNPLNFNDQCSAFIGSDIKTAIQTGARKEDCVAGLVYSVCMNYMNRVKGSRSVGKKIFMQGGVCYNEAVPLAMAILCGREIIVPPDPGLMGAFGAALVVSDRIRSGLSPARTYDLAELARREIETGGTFTCSGGREKCDLKCAIGRYRVRGKTYTFGGACDRYYNLTEGNRAPGAVDLVSRREDMVLRQFAPDGSSGTGKTVGIPLSLYTATAYPLYSHFFTNLKMKVIKGDKPDAGGMEEAGSPFCLPVLQSHGFVKQLLSEDPDYIFIPHVKNAFTSDGGDVNCTCPLVQGEPYYLKAAFDDSLPRKIITAVLDFRDPGLLSEAFAGIGKQLGFSRDDSHEAFERAWLVFMAFFREMRSLGREGLNRIGRDEKAIVVFGRAYNAFTRLGNMGVPRKFACRGYRVIPYDFLSPGDNGPGTVRKMYWASGQGILQAARVVRDNPNLFGVYITNFSCGPDSFVLERFRGIMGSKPFLTLEFDAHTADAGVDTRIEAFLDVVAGYSAACAGKTGMSGQADCAQVQMLGGEIKVRTSDNRTLDLRHPEIHVLIPSMGETGSGFLAAVMRHFGIRATALDPPDSTVMALGRNATSCKECLPYTLTTGSLFHYLKNHGGKDETLVYFMPETSGPCRFGQFNISMAQLAAKSEIRNVAMLSLTCENGYAGLPADFSRRSVLAMVIADGLDDVRAGILTLARDREGALA
ncbi:MAG: acyl-CoA dehydratase activase, partial [Pseudomonadota bacterium]